MKTGTPFIIAATLALAISGAALADKKNSPEQMAFKYRDSAFTMVKHHFGPMGGMVKGEIDFNAEIFSKNAANLATLSQLAPNGFMIEGLAEKSRAKKAIWENREDFDAKMKEFQDAASGLAEAAKSGDMETIKPAFGRAAKTCKSCHKEYKKK